MKTQHTEGPWIKNGDRIENEDGALIAGVFDGTFYNEEDRETKRANGYLIAAAPDLLVALDMCRRAMSSVLPDFNPFDQAAYDKADVAIRKALGKLDIGE